MDNNPEARLKEMGIELPPPPPPVANFVPAVLEGNLLYLSGQGPVGRDFYHHGKVGAGVSVEDAYAHARLVTLNLLSVMKAELGTLSRVKRIVKILGLVNAAPDFMQHPQVINGCSDLLVEVFGPAGRHARSAVGAGSLPGQITVEIEMIVAIS